MAKNRNNRKRRRRRRGRGGGAGVVLTFLAVLVIIGAIVAALTIFFKIRTVAVTGDSRYTSGDIVASSGIETQKNMFLFNKFAAVSRIFAAHPYLDEVSIRRHLPDTVEIIVTECEPVVILDAVTHFSDGKLQTTGRGYYLIDIKGKLLEQVDGPEGYALPLVKGTSLKNPEVGKYAVFADELTEKPLFLVLNSLKDHAILLNIGFIDFSEPYNISFEYQERFLVKLGTTEELAWKLQYMEAIINEPDIDEAARGTIDVSSPGTTGRFIRGK